MIFLKWTHPHIINHKPNFNFPYVKYFENKNIVGWDVDINTAECWVKTDQLDATCFIITLFSAQHVLDVNTSILRSLRLIRWVTSWVVSGSMCVGVTLQCGCGGVVSVCRVKPVNLHWPLSYTFFFTRLLLPFFLFLFSLP